MLKQKIGQYLGQTGTCAVTGASGLVTAELYYLNETPKLVLMHDRPGKLNYFGPDSSIISAVQFEVDEISRYLGAPAKQVLN